MTTSKDETWIQRDGTPILVRDMTEGHVRATLRMILRQRRKRQELIGTISSTGWKRELIHLY
jgi:hypothetical protein